MPDYEEGMTPHYGGHCPPQPMAPKSPEPILSRLMMLEDAVRGLQSHLEKLAHILDEVRREIGIG